MLILKQQQTSRNREQEINTIDDYLINYIQLD